MANKKWTKEEENILVRAITANPHNIKEACNYASSQLENRTPDACKLHWYQVLSIKDNSKTNIAFVTIGSKTVYKNRKNSIHSTIKPEKFTLWAKIKKIIGLK